MYIVVTPTDGDYNLPEEEGWGPFDSLNIAALWADENLTQWWWIIHVNEPWMIKLPK